MGCACGCAPLMLPRLASRAFLASLAVTFSPSPRISSRFSIRCSVPSHGCTGTPVKCASIAASTLPPQSLSRATCPRRHRSKQGEKRLHGGTRHNFTASERAMPMSSSAKTLPADTKPMSSAAMAAADPVPKERGLGAVTSLGHR